MSSSSKRKFWVCVSVEAPLEGIEADSVHHVGDLLSFEDNNGGAIKSSTVAAFREWLWWKEQNRDQRGGAE